MAYSNTYNASEGFFAIQDQRDSTDLQLMLDYGIYYEFLPVNSINAGKMETIQLSDVEVDVIMLNYKYKCRSLVGI